MTTTDVSAPDVPTGAIGDGPVADPPEETTAAHRADAAALRDLMRPVAANLAVGRALAAVSGALAVVPYIALVHIGTALLVSGRTATDVQGDEVTRWLQILLVAFTLRLMVYFVALLVTHLADIKLGHLIRSRLVRRLSRVPWSGSPPPTPAASARRCRTTSVRSTI